MSLFGQPAQAQTGGGLFGGATQSTGGLFGQSTQTQPQSSGGLFGGVNQPKSTGLFGASTTAQPQQTATSSLFGNTQTTQQQPQGGLFGGQQSQQPQQPQQQQPQQQQQQQQLAQAQGSLFANSTQLGRSLQAQQNQLQSREKSVPDQMQTVAKKWLPGQSPDCVFQYYFYNKVDENQVRFYQPGPGEDPKAWEEALGKKPGPAYIPVLCTGYEQLAQRIKVQAVNLSAFNRALHAINDQLTACLHSHETSHSVRALDAKRKHAQLRQRCLRIATKVQVLRNRGYALGGDEEDLKTKLQELERKANDPALGARAEEIWARMLTVQERAKVLKAEIEKSGAEASEVLDEDTTKKAKKILEDYDRQLVHLKKEMELIQKEYEEWEKSQKSTAEQAKSSAYRSSIR